MTEYFPGKTNRQISDARRRLNSPTMLKSITECITPQTPNPVEPDLHACEASTSASPQNPEDDNWYRAIITEIRGLNKIPDKWVRTVTELIALTDTGNENDVNTLYNDLVSKLTKDCKPIDTHSGKRRNRRRERPANRAMRRRYAYAKCQELINKCPKKIADAAIANDLSLLQLRQAPSTAETRELYTGLWGSVGSKMNSDYEITEIIPTSQIWHPITPKEVQDKIKRIAGSSAAGITKASLKEEGISIVLSKLFNILLLKKVYPEAWKRNRTTPKAGKDTKDVKNWRLITISSMLRRTFSSLLDRRLRNIIRQNTRQKGFTEENGCFANTRLLGAAIGEAKISGGIFTVLDISKAFDTVPHQAIRLGLKRNRIPATVIDYISSMYTGCHTQIKTRDDVIHIELKKGVKQGDPLSPILFNLAIEHIIEMVQDDYPGIPIENHNLGAMAFADDIILLARDRDTAIQQVTLVYNELKKRGSALSIEKSLSFQYVPRNRTWYVRDPELVVRGIPIWV